MPLVVSTSAGGFKHLQKALYEMGDERGVKWKRSAMLKAGDIAFRPVVYGARALAPVKTGYLRRNLVASRARYNKNPDKAFGARGKLRKGYKHEYTIGTTLKSSFKGPRYPFMLEVGVPSQTYERKAHTRLGKPVKATTVTRTAPRKPLLFQHRALGSNANKVVELWKSSMSYHIGLYSKSTFATLNKAIKSDRSTGRNRHNWNL